MAGRSTCLPPTYGFPEVESHKMFQSHTLSTLALAALLGSGLSAQVPSFAPPPSSPELLDAFAVSDATTQNLAPVAGAASLQFHVWINGQMETLDLAPFDVRSPNLRVLVTDDSGRTRQIPAAPSVTYRGTLVGRPESAVTASFFDGGLRAMIWFTPDTPAWGIDPVNEVNANAPVTEHIVYDSSNFTHQGTCGVTDNPTNIFQAGSPQTTGTDMVKIAEIAITADAPFCQQYGNNTTTIQNVMTGIMNSVDFIYDRDTEIQYDVNILELFTSGSDPFTTTNAGALLDQFRNRGLSVHSGVVRDVNHLFSGRNFQGSTLGVAFLSGICNNLGYGISDMATLQSSTFRTAVCTHELGHNWSSGHCSGGGCNIMCAGLGGCSGNISVFSQSVINTIVAYKNTRTCLDDGGGPPPVISAITPNVIEVLNGSAQITGTGLSTVTEVRFIGFELDPSEFTIVNDGLITIDTVLPPNLNPNFCWVIGSAGSNLVPVGFTPATDASLDIPQFHSPVLADWPVAYAHQPGYFYALFGSLNNPTTVPVLGIDFLASAFQIASGTVDPVTGAGSLEIDILPGTLIAQTLFMQCVTIDTGFTTVFSSPVKSTFFLN